MRALLLCIALIGCREKQPDARAIVSPTPQEAEAFGKEFVKYLVPCDAAELDRRIDSDLMLARGFASRRMSAAHIAGFKRGFPGVGAVTCRQMVSEQNVDARYLRILTVKGAPRPLIRMVMDGALNYSELELDKHDGKVRVADMEIYMAGQSMSESLGMLIDVLLDRGDASKAIKRMNEHMLVGEWQQALDIFNALPAEVRASKPVRLAEIRIVSNLDDGKYLAAMDSYVRAFPNDPALTLMLIDRAILSKRYDEAHRVIDQLDRRVGGDPYLDVFRANVFEAEGKSDEATKAATRAAKNAPELVAVWWSLLSRQAAEARYADAIPTLAKLRDEFGQDVSAATLGPDERFTALVESAEYQDWAAR